MKKIYYEVEVRIYEITSDQDDDVFEELRSFSDGFILLEDDSFEGCLTNDQISGEFDGNELSIEILDYNDEYWCFSCDADEFQLPGKYILENNIEDESICEITFKEKVTNRNKQIEIETEYERVKEIYLLP